MASLSGSPYEATAETLHPSQVAFVRREAFLRFVASHPEAFQSLVIQLSSEYRGACEQLRTVGLPANPRKRLARLLLTWSAGTQQTTEGSRINMPLTHEEIAECIGASRETVTRALSDLKIRHLVCKRGSTVMIPSRAALESFVNV
jgi:CRP/FNR family transcriptional regulator, cyclic AMP receptor protein